MFSFINVPVSDLRREPIPCQGGDDPLQESQLLYGEEVVILEEKGEWLFVEAEEQLFCYPDGKWSGYPGWVRKEHVYTVTNPLNPKFIVTSLSHFYHFGTKLSCGEFRPLDKPFNLAEMLSFGNRMLGFPYFWGGRSNRQVDCSGFVNLLFRSQGIDLPRNAHDQYLKCHPTSNPQPGDLLFTAKNDRITHVMLYADKGDLLEATMKTNSVRRIPASHRVQELKKDYELFPMSIQSIKPRPLTP